jgi:hypothetical protein
VGYWPVEKYGGMKARRWVSATTWLTKQFLGIYLRATQAQGTDTENATSYLNSPCKLLTKISISLDKDVHCLKKRKVLQ